MSSAARSASISSTGCARTRRALLLCHDKKFPGGFGFAMLRDLPDLERLEDEGLLLRPQSDIDLDGALGLVEDDGEILSRPWVDTRN
jgi:hypothetical protein